LAILDIVFFYLLPDSEQDFSTDFVFLGLFKYGRGSIKPMATTESVRIKPWYAYLQHDSAKEANSRQASG
jgi:hypothetical protein